MNALATDERQKSQRPNVQVCRYESDNQANLSLRTPQDEFQIRKHVITWQAKSYPCRYNNCGHQGHIRYRLMLPSISKQFNTNHAGDKHKSKSARFCVLTTKIVTNWHNLAQVIQRFFVKPSISQKQKKFREVGFTKFLTFISWI
jgi:hypothetical protein